MIRWPALVTTITLTFICFLCLHPGIKGNYPFKNHHTIPYTNNKIQTYLVNVNIGVIVIDLNHIASSVSLLVVFRFEFCFSIPVLLLEACVAVVFWGKDGVLSVTRIFERNSINLFIFERNSINLLINICYLLLEFSNVIQSIFSFSNVIQSIFSSIFVICY